MTSSLAFQDRYPEDVSHCYGCGRLNPHGIQLKSRWEGDETVARYRPRPYHTAIPGFVYGGLIASLIDCHGTGSAAAAFRRAEIASGTSPESSDGESDDRPLDRFVTASLHVDYLKPTPIDGELELRGVIREIRGRKVVVSITLSAGGVVTARGEVVAARMPDTMTPAGPAASPAA